MNVAQEYRLYKYQDHGTLGTKEHIKLVRDKETGRVCVKKILDYTQRDVLEFRKRNCSRYFPQVYEVFAQEKEVVVIEEYVAGITLEEYMAGNPLPEAGAVRIAVQICEALLELHHATPMIVYRDLKPENIMITTEDDVKLVDFNISRTFHQGQKRDTVLLGTAEYAAPEQFGYSQTDNRTDIYAFGVVFNYMLTGHFPIDGVCEGKYAGVIKKCIEMEPSKRYQTVETLLMDLGMNQVKKERSEDKTMSWTIPGFRSHIFWKELVAVLGYLFVFFLGLTMEFTHENGELYPLTMQWTNRILFTLAQLFTIFFCCNYRRISDEISFYRHRLPIVRIISYAVTWFAAVVVAVLISTVVENIL